MQKLMETSNVGRRRHFLLGNKEASWKKRGKFDGVVLKIHHQFSRWAINGWNEPFRLRCLPLPPSSPFVLALIFVFVSYFLGVVWKFFKDSNSDDSFVSYRRLLVDLIGDTTSTSQVEEKTFDN